MKRLVSLFIILISGMTLFAAEVSQQEAMEKARAFMQKRQGGSKAMHRAQLSLNMQQTDAGTQLLYAFNIEGGGYVIASGDDLTIPILGYSLTGSIDTDDMPDNMRSWLQSYADDICRLSKSYTAFQQTEDTGLAPITPLLHTTWYQVNPYDLMTPVYEGTEKSSWKGKHSATGCVATAMAQVMYYHRWPQDATTTIPSYTFMYNEKEPCTLPELPATTFKWDQMLPNYTTEQPGTEAQRMAVAELMRYCGQAVKMTYTPEASGTQHEFIVNALRRYFGYSQATHNVNRSGYTIEGWKQVIWNELNHKRPVCFGGQSSSGGHEFVIDGYDGNGMFHVNWGWAGMNDGYFAINVLNPKDNTSVGSASSTDLGFATNQQIILGMEKSTGQETEVPEVVKKLTLYNELITVDTIMVYQAAYTDFNLENTAYYMGLGIRNDDGTFVPVLKNDTTTKYINGMIAGQFYKTKQLSLADGSYALWPIAREADDATATWQTFCEQGQCFYVDVKDAKATLRRSMKLKIVDAHFETTPTPLEENTLVVVVENQDEQEVSTVTRLKVSGKSKQGKSLSALDIKTTLRPTEIYPGERTTLTYPMTIPCQGDLDVELEYFLGLVTHDKAKVTVENSPHFYDLQLVDYTIDYKDSKTIDAVFYVKNNDTRLWQDPFSIVMQSSMEGANSVRGSSHDAVPSGQIIELIGLGLEDVLYQDAAPKDVRIMVYPDYAGFFLGDFLLDVTVKMGTKVTPQGVTAIDGIRTVDSNLDAPYYDLQGRRLQGKPTQKGLYIHNGKIVTR